MLFSFIGHFFLYASRPHLCTGISGSAHVTSLRKYGSIGSDMFYALIFGCVLHLAVLPSSALDVYDVTVNTSRIIAPLRHFWRSTGFCPPDPHQMANVYDLSEDERQNIMYIGALPNQAISQVRIHWLLDLVTATQSKQRQQTKHGNSEGGSGAYVYNFTYLDHLLDLLRESGLKPGFELMGNPSNRFSSFDDSEQVYEWKNLVYTLAMRYIQRYGLPYVRTWNFETWNEPDHRDFDNLTISVQGFLNYYDACSEGLKAADPSLTFGGPAGSCHPKTSESSRCWALFDHVTSGENYFTKEKGVRINFISFHRKGRGHSLYILEQELIVMDQIRKMYPQLAKVPTYNDEGDPLEGWNRSEDWRSDARYAAVAVKIIAQHQNLILSRSSEYPFALLSNDDAFMNFGPADFFDQRTLTVRFQMNNTKPKSVETIQKPVASALGILSLLGEQQLDGRVAMKGGINPVGNDSRVGLIASLHHPQTELWDSFQLGIVIYNSNDTSEMDPLLDAQINLSLSDLQSVGADLDGLVFVHYRLDNDHGDPLKIWKDGGSPVFPSDGLLDEMRSNQDPVRLEGPSLVVVSHDMFWTTSFDLPYPSVSFFHFCSKPRGLPSQVTNVSLHQVYRNEVLVSWKDVPSRCLSKFNVMFSTKSASGPFMLASDKESLSTILSHRIPGISSGTTEVFYKVSAVDYWNHEGPPSQIVSVAVVF